MSDLPEVAPRVLAAELDALPGRLRRRAESLAADRAAWTLHRDDDLLTVDLGAVVTVQVDPAGAPLVDPTQVRCACLLAPRCAHRVAVLLAAPAAETGADRADADRGGDHVPAAVPPADSPPPDARHHLTDEQREALDRAAEHVGELLTHGAHRADASLTSALHADLQVLRARGLVVAERALTAVVHEVGHVGGHESDDL